MSEYDLLILHLRNLTINKRHYDTLDDDLKKTVDKVIADGLAEWKDDEIKLTQKGEEYEFPEN